MIARTGSTIGFLRPWTAIPTERVTTYATPTENTPSADQRPSWLSDIIAIRGYAVYNYALYPFGAAPSVFFLLYVLAFVVAVVAIILALSRLDVAVVARSFRPAAPVRALGGSLPCIGIGLASVWIAMWAAHVFAGRPTPVDPEAFKIVAALDLSLMVPSLTAGGILLWRRRPWGYVIASLASIQRALYLLVLSGQLSHRDSAGSGERPW
jgi:hypothetical protein